MTEMYAHVSVRILEKEYQISCPANERTELLDSAEMLNAKMREIRDSGKVVGLDRIAVLAALNMANELLKSKANDRRAGNKNWTTTKDAGRSGRRSPWRQSTTGPGIDLRAGLSHTHAVNCLYGVSCSVRY